MSPDFLVFFFLMIRRPPRSTRTDTLFPYTTLFRSPASCSRSTPMICSSVNLLFLIVRLLVTGSHVNCGSLWGANHVRPHQPQDSAGSVVLGPQERRSEERRVGKVCVSTCISG